MVLVEIKEMGAVIIGLVATALLGALATFFVYLSSHKRKFWELIYETSNKTNGKRF